MIKVYQLKALQNNYIVSIPFKGVKVRCEFKGGNIAKGIYARLYTNDPFKQMAVEQCEMNGKMWKLVETVKEPEDTEPAKKEAKKTVMAPQKSKDKPVEPPVGNDESSTDNEPPADDDKTDTPPQDGDTVLDFANPAEAILYIASNFGQQVENESQARKFFKENGIKAVIHKG